MSQTKLGPTLSVAENEQLESHSFWFEQLKCSLKVDRRKDGDGLAVTLKSQDAKVVIHIGPQDAPRFVTQIKHAKDWNSGCQFASAISGAGVKLTFDYEPGPR